MVGLGCSLRVRFGFWDFEPWPFECLLPTFQPAAGNLLALQVSTCPVFDEGNFPMGSRWPAFDARSYCISTICITIYIYIHIYIYIYTCTYYFPLLVLKESIITGHRCYFIQWTQAPASVRYHFRGGAPTLSNEMPDIKPLQVSKLGWLDLFRVRTRILRQKVRASATPPNHTHCK